MTTSANAGVALSPEHIDFMDGSKKRTKTLTVINNSEKTQSYRVEIAHYDRDENGKLIPVEGTPDNSAAPYIVFSPKQFTLPKGKFQTVRVVKKSMTNAKDGEYVSYLRVGELGGVLDPNQQDDDEEENDGEQKLGVSIKPLIAMNIPVTIYKGDNLNQETDIISKKINGDKLEVVLKRKGNISSRVILSVINSDGREIAQSGKIRIYQPNGKRNVSIRLEKEKGVPAKLRMIDTLSNNVIKEVNL